MVVNKENLEFLYNLIEMLGVSIGDVYLRKFIRSLNEDLDSMERDVLLYRFKEKKSLSDVSEAFGKSVEEISRIESLSLKMLKGTMYNWYIPNLFSKAEEIKKKNSDLNNENLYLKKVVEEYERRFALPDKDKYTTDIRDISVLGLSPRPYNALIRAGIFKINQLWELSEIDLMNIRNMGQKSVKEIKMVLTSMGKVY